MQRLLAALAVLSLTSAASMAAQQPTPAAPASTTLAVFLDCQNVGCDFAYVQTEITAVVWVRDRSASDVHVLVTGQDTGAGGREFTLTFIGLRGYNGLTDTLKFTLPPSFTDEERRQNLVRYLRLGLVRYAARTPLGSRMTVSFGAVTAASQAKEQPKKDPWHTWVFSLDLGSYMQGEKTYRSRDVYSGVEANRVTKLWKTQLSANRGDSRSEFDLDDTTTFVNTQRNFNASALHAKSLGEHWSVGARGGVSASTYDNFRQAVRLTPAIEFDVFPYSASTRRQLRVEYNAGLAAFAYHDTTINDKTDEQMPIHRLSVSVTARQPWGTVDVGLNGTQYLNNTSLYRAGAFGSVNLKLAKGLSLRAFGNYQSIHDQFFLAKKTFTQQQILTRQFQRGTTFRYFGNVNLSYTFGSIFSTVVNPRFGGNND